MKPKLRTVTRTQGANEQITNGQIRLPGYDLDFVDVPVLVQAFTRMVRGLEYDVSEMALTTYLTAKEHGREFTALPIFLVRGLHHGAIVHNVTAGIREPKDLEGRVVAVGRGYTVTTGVWARDILEREHGVDLSAVTWMRTAQEHVNEVELPSNVLTAPEGTTAEELLASGSVDAAVNVAVDHPDVRPLLDDPEEAALRSVDATGVYPINHVIVVKNQLLESFPTLAGELFDAFATAKRSYVARLRSGDVRDATDATNAAVMARTGRDPLPYGIAGNEPTLDALIDASLRQGILQRRPSYDSLFAAGTLDLVG